MNSPEVYVLMAQMDLQIMVELFKNKEKAEKRRKELKASSKRYVITIDKMKVQE
jgi:PII-like signaling protein